MVTLPAIENVFPSFVMKDVFICRRHKVIKQLDEMIVVWIENKPQLACELCLLEDSSPTMFAADAVAVPRCHICGGFGTIKCLMCRRRFCTKDGNILRCKDCELIRTKPVLPPDDFACTFGAGCRGSGTNQCSSCRCFFCDDHFGNSEASCVFCLGFAQSMENEGGKSPSDLAGLL